MYRRTLLGSLPALGFLLFNTLTALAQIDVAPTRVMLSMRERSQEVTVSNNTNDPVEVDVDLGFKLIRSDSLGSITLDSTGTAEEMAKSGRAWLKAYPKRFTLAPGSSRMVRVLATIPGNADDGEYWARLMVTGTPAAGGTPVDGTGDSDIRTDLKMRLQLDLPVIIRKGQVETGIEIEGVEARRQDEGVALLLDMHRTGNSAYRGTIRSLVRDAEGREVAQREEQFTTEFSLRKSLHLPALPDGNYTVVVESESIKKGGAMDAVIQAPAVHREYKLTLTGSRAEVATIR